MVAADRCEGQLSVVRFQAGGHRFAVETRWVRAMLHRPAAGAVTMERLLGLTLAPGGRNWLVMQGESEPVCIEVGEPVGLGVIAAAVIRLPPTLVAARIGLPALAALALEDGGALLLLDGAALIGRGANPPPR